jgi:hypothetical protein
MRPVMIKESPRTVGVIAGCLTALVILAPVVNALGRPKSDECGGQGNAVQAEFAISNASHVWKYLPAMLQAPELDSDSRPAYVAIFNGAFNTQNILIAGRGGPGVQEYQDVVCVIQEDGTVNIYTDVSRSGALLP